MSKKFQIEEKSKMVRDIMSKKIVSMNADTSTLELAKAMSEKRISSIILTDNDGSDIGIVTERDLTREVCAKDVLASKKAARSIMSSRLININEAASVENAAETMVKNGTRHLVVEQIGNVHDTNYDRHKIVGVVTTTDIAKYLRGKIQPTTAVGPDETLWEAMYLADDGSYDEQC